MNTASCPICDRALTGESPANQPLFPFCSERCRLIDLGRWLGEAYPLPGEPDSETLAAPGENDEDP